MRHGAICEGEYKHTTHQRTTLQKHSQLNTIIGSELGRMGRDSLSNLQWNSFRTLGRQREREERTKSDDE